MPEFNDFGAFREFMKSERDSGRAPEGSRAAGRPMQTDWSETVRDWVGRLSAAEAMYSDGVFALADAGTITSVEDEVTIKRVAFGKHEYPATKIVDKAVLGRGREEKLADRGGEDAVAEKIQSAEAVFDAVSQEFLQSVEDQLMDDTVTDPQWERLERLSRVINGIKATDPDAMQHNVKTGHPNIDRFHALSQLIINIDLAKQGASVIRPRGSSHLQRLEGPSYQPPEGGPPMADDRMAAVGSVFAEMLEKDGADKALDFAWFAFQDPDSLMATISEANVMLWGFNEPEIFLNGMFGKLSKVDDNRERPLIVEIDEDCARANNLDDEDRLVRVSPDEIIIVGGNLNSTTSYAKGL